jgi:hypothetical protein
LQHLTRHVLRLGLEFALCTVVAVVGLLAFLRMVLFTVILFLIVYGPLNPNPPMMSRATP